MQSNAILLRIDAEGSEPLYTRIAAAVRKGLAAGEISPGDRLPTGRALAEELGVNMHTVLRAYGELRDEGIIDLRRRRGAVVLEGAEDASKVATATAQLIAVAKHHGMRVEDVVHKIEEEWQ